MIHNSNLFAAFGFPAKKFRYIRHGGGRIDAYMQKFNSVFRQMWNHGFGMSRHIGHFSSDCLFTKPLIQFL